MRPLFVLDLNGTLLERLTTSTAKQAYRSNPHHNPASAYDLTVNGTQIVLRPHLHHLMRCLIIHGDVAVWTSMTSKNATAICKAVLGQYRLQFVWTQEECELVERGGGSGGFVKPLMRKPLDKIWRAFPDLYNNKNTIMIDDSREKILEAHQGNHLHIAEFDIYRGDFRADRVLLELFEYIDRFMQQGPVTDYRQLVSDHAESKGVSKGC